MLNDESKIGLSLNIVKTKEMRMNDRVEDRLNVGQVRPTAELTHSSISGASPVLVDRDADEDIRSKRPKTNEVFVQFYTI